MFRIVAGLIAFVFISTAQGAGFDFAALKNLINSKNVKSIEQLIPLLPEEFRAEYVLMYKSRSLQEASFANPRAIVYGKDAKFVLAFNGESSQKGFSDLETVEFNDLTKHFEFREISFSNGVQFSETNPQKCLRCHQSATRANVDPRPNWEPYSFWPGAYGGEDGRFTHSPTRRAQHEKILEKDPEMLAIIAAGDKESDAIADYLQLAPDHPRYKHLGPFKTYKNGYGEVQTRGPTELTRLLTFWNYKRVARLARETKTVYANYKYALLGSMLCFNNADFKNFNSYLPSRLVSIHSESTRVKEYSSNTTVADFALGIRRIFEPWGVDTSDWSMDFRTQGRLSFSSRFGGPGTSNLEMYQAFVEMDPSAGGTCKALREKSLKALSSQNPPPPPTQSSRNSPHLLKRCVDCHTGVDRQAPYLPFDRREDLRALLKSNKFDRGTLLQEILYRVDPATDSGERMPPSGDVSPGDLSALIRFFEDLSK